MRKSKILGIFILIILPTMLWSQNDTLVLKNNDKIIGEIKELNQGVVTFKTSYSDKDFKIKWRDVIEVNTVNRFLITLSKGQRFYSNITNDKDKSNTVIIFENSDKHFVKISDIVYLTPQKSSFFSRMRFSTISGGYSYTKSNSVKQFNVSSKLYYTTFKYKLTGTYNSTINSQRDVEETKRINADLNLNYFMKKDWFYIGALGFSTNDEQKLALRTSISAGMGKYLIHSNIMTLGTGAGLAYTNESFSDTDDTVQNSLEFFISAGYQIYNYHDLTFSFNSTFYPSLTENDRYRADLNVSLDYDLPWDFFIQLSYIFNFDSEPVNGASTTDYSLQTTLGWKFK